MCSGKINESVAMNPDMSLEEIEKLTINFENSMSIEEKSEVIAIRDSKREYRLTYAAVTGIKKPIRHNIPQVIKPLINNQGRQYSNSKRGLQVSERRQPVERSNEYDKPKSPMGSMKHIVRRVYNIAKGLPEPELRRLQPGECYCCCGSGHFRNNCPLNKRCLICG